ncbi:hypothetical protein [Vibrio parahaemolyticus]|uniref:hypothetical protein n=1 Tax=Vibrio parahaemolyticus TaxID=670 RepID=UPI00193DD193|nr:hypothetical protein [Vibrio parahaemolyticus]MBM4805856.1 hypothetical protein [Vibrio parahaemolyticus]
MGNVACLSILAVSCIGLLAALIGYEFGWSHPLTMYSIGAFIAIVFFKISDGERKFGGVSSIVWAALVTNVVWLVITFLSLPSLEAIEATKEINNPTLFSVLWAK